MKKKMRSSNNGSSARISLESSPGLMQQLPRSSKSRWVQVLSLISITQVSIVAATSALQIQPGQHPQSIHAQDARLLRGGGDINNSRRWSSPSSEAVEEEEETSFYAAAEEETTTRQLSSSSQEVGGQAAVAPWPVMLKTAGDITVPYRKQRDRVHTKQAADDGTTATDATIEPLVIGVTMLVSSISKSPSAHSVETTDLQKILESFAEIVVDDWAYRRLLMGNNIGLPALPAGTSTTNNEAQQPPLQEENFMMEGLLVGSMSDIERSHNYLRNRRTPNNHIVMMVPAEQKLQQQQQQQQHNRRLQAISLVPNSVLVSEDLTTSTDCTVSVSQAASGFPHCHIATGSFQILPESSNTPRVCRNMQTTILDNGAEYFDQAVTASGLTDSGLIISPPPTETNPNGAMSTCQVAEATPAPTGPHSDGNVFNHTGTSDPSNATTDATTNAPNSSSSAPTDTATTPPPSATATAAATTSPPGTTTPNDTTPPTTAAPSSQEGGGTNTTTTTTAPTTTTTTPAPGSGGGSNGTTTGTEAPTEEGSFVNEWLSVLNGEDEDAAESGNAWLDTVDGAAADGEAGPDTPAPAPEYNHSAITAEVAAERKAYWDDSTLDRVVMILLICLGSLFVLICCCYWGDAAWIRYRLEQLYTADEEHFHDGRWYYDEAHKFPRADCAGKPPPGDFQQLSEGFEEGSIESESEEDDEDSMFMSDSEESDDDFDFDEDHDFTDGTGNDESGDFYVDYDEEDEDVDVFDESEEEDPDETSMFTGDPSLYGGDEDYTDTNRYNEESDDDSDFFNDEADKEQAKPAKRKK